MLQWTFGCIYFLMWCFHLLWINAQNWDFCIIWVQVLIFRGNSLLFFIVAVPDFIPNNSAWRFTFLHILSKTFCFLPFWSSPFWNVWCYISWWHYVLYLLAFPLWLVLLIEHLLIAWWPPVCLLWKNIYLDPLPIFNWILCFCDIEFYVIFVYFGYYSPLLDISFISIFSHLVGCL